MDFDLSIVIDEDVLNELVGRSKYAKFLMYWLQENDTKAVIVMSSWDEFFNFWDKNLDKGEVKDVFYRFIKGLVRPYRKDGVTEIHPKEPIKETKIIINRDYDMVNFLIVGKPENYKDDEIKISHNSIIDLRSFYNLFEISQPEFVRQFLMSYMS